MRMMVLSCHQEEEVFCRSDLFVSLFCAVDVNLRWRRPRSIGFEVTNVGQPWLERKILESWLNCRRDDSLLVCQ